MFFSLTSRNERGQVIIMVALALTVLVAMTGLVIDGGMAWSNRRQVQNAADAAALAGTRVLGLDLKWRAVNASNPSPPSRPFADPDAAVCDAINNALAYNTNAGQGISSIDCYTGSDSAWYVDFDRNRMARVGEGIPSLAQGVEVVGTGESDTLLMGVVGISTIDVNADAVALAGPGEPPIGNLMPFVVANPLGPFVPGEQYQMRSEDEGECDTASVDLTEIAADAGIVLAMANPDATGDIVLAAAQAPAVPIADPPSQSFTTSITVTLSGENNTTIRYTTDGTAPTSSSPQYTGPLTFTSTTTLKAIAVRGSHQSEVGTFTYTQETPPEAPTATPGDGHEFDTSVTVSLASVTPGVTIYYTTDGTTPSNTSAAYTGPLTFAVTTQLRAIAYAPSGVKSTVSTFNYVRQGDTAPPTANPGTGTDFGTTLNVTLSTVTPGATIYYTTNGAAPTTSSSQYTGIISLVSTTTIRAMASGPDGDSLVSEFTYTKTGPVCPELAAGNFGWVDFSGGSNSNADLVDDIRHPENADIDWYYRECAGPSDTNCREVHDPADPADDHWWLEGTPGHRNVAMRAACEEYLGEIIYVPIWDDWVPTSPSGPAGNNAVFHLIGFAAFRLDGVIDNHPVNGTPTSDACGAGLNAGGTPNDKGFIGTYVDSFVGTQVAPCIPSPDGTNPCANLQNDRLEINLAQ